MIVLDASAVLELLLNTPVGHDIADEALDPASTLHAPHLIDLEVAQVLRRIRDLRNDLTAYDAAYVALAESLPATLVTCDERLARGTGRSVRVKVFPHP